MAKEPKPAPRYAQVRGDTIAGVVRWAGDPKKHIYGDDIELVALSEGDNTWAQALIGRKRDAIVTLAAPDAEATAAKAQKNTTQKAPPVDMPDAHETGRFERAQSTVSGKPQDEIDHERVQKDPQLARDPDRANRTKEDAVKTDNAVADLRGKDFAAGKEVRQNEVKRQQEDQRLPATPSPGRVKPGKPANKR